MSEGHATVAIIESTTITVTPISFFDTLNMASSAPTYIKGYGVDRAKIMHFLNSVDSTDGRIDRVVLKILDYVDKREHPICGGHTLGDSTNMNVIAFGNDAFGDDLDKLKKKELTHPKYLEKATGLLRGPEVFEFVAW